MQSQSLSLDYPSSCSSTSLVQLLFSSGSLLRSKVVSSATNRSQKVCTRDSLLFQRFSPFLLAFVLESLKKVPCSGLKPTVFGMRALGMFAFYPLEDPRDFLTLGIMTLMLTSAIGENVCQSTYFCRNSPKNIRETSFGVNTAHRTIGTFFLSFVGGYFNDKVSSKVLFLLTRAVNKLS